MLRRCFVGTIGLGLVVAAEAPAFAWSGSEYGYGNQPVVPPSVSASRCLHGQPVSFTSGGFSAGKTVTVKDNDEAVGSAPVGPDGVFSINVKMSHCGANRLTAVGTSPDGSTATVAAAVDGICGDVASAVIAGTADSTSDTNSGDVNGTEVAAPPAAGAGETGVAASTSVAGTSASAATTSATPETTEATAGSTGAAGITETSGPAGGTTSPVTATALPRTGSDVVGPAAVTGTALLLLGGTAVVVSRRRRQAEQAAE